MMITTTNSDFQPTALQPTSALAAKELAFATLLGLVLEPVQNKIALTPELSEQVQELTMVFQVSKAQQSLLRPLCTDAWIDLVPWHSFN
jgi:hypothetical protein